MAKVTFSDEGISVEIEGDADKVKAMAAQLQNKSGVPQDTIGKLLEKADDNPELIQMIASQMGFSKFNPSNVLAGIKLFKGFLK